MSRAPSWVVALALVATPELARGQRAEAQGACERIRSAPRAPIELALGGPGTPALAQFGSTPSACGYRGFSISGGGGALVATSAFYGALDAEATLSGTYRIDADSWVTLAMDVLRYRTVINATVVTAPIDFGASTVTVHHSIARDQDAEVTGFVRALFPTESSTRFGARLGFETGFSVLYNPHRRWSLHGGVSLPVTATISAGGALFTFSPRATLDLAWLPADVFEILAGLEARGGLDGFEYLAPRVALRVHGTRAVFVDLSAMAPLLGLERSLARGALTVGARF